MSLTAKDSGEKYPMIAEGIHAAVCTKVVDLGSQYNTTFNKTYPKVRIFWEIPGQTIEVNGETVPRSVFKDFTNSLSEKGNLRPMLQAWRGKAFTPEELQGFDLRKLLGVGCQLQIIHKAGERGQYANVETVMALPNGTTAPKASETAFFDMDDPTTHTVFNALPLFVQKMIAKSENFGDTGLALSQGENGDTHVYSTGFHEISDENEPPF